MTTNSDLPGEGTAVETTPETYNQQVEGIANLLDDPDDEPDLQQADQDPEAAPDAPEGEAEKAEDAEEVEAKEPDDGPQDEPEIKGGRFAPDSAKVTLDDGTVITVAELKRNNLFQRDYTVKTTELAETRKVIESKKSEVDQLAQSLNQQREYVLWFAENYLPKQPHPSEMQADPIGYMQRKEAWEQGQQVLQHFVRTKQQETEQQQQQALKASQERAQSEMKALLERAPDLRDVSKRTAFFQTAVTSAAEHYGFSEPEIRAIGDHRLILALKDALAYRSLKTKAPQVVEQVQKKPAMVTGGKRAAPGAQDTRDRLVRSERLRKDGSLEAGAAALMDFDL